MPTTLLFFGNYRLKKLLSDRLVTNLSVAGSRTTINDTKQPGFSLRIGASGKCAWIASYRIGRGRGGIKKLVTLGRPPVMACEDARHLAALLVVDGRKNVDLKAVWDAEEIAEKEARDAKILAYYSDFSPDDLSFLKNAWVDAMKLKSSNSARYQQNLLRLWKYVELKYGHDIKTVDLDIAKLSELKNSMSKTPAQFNKFRAALNSVLEREVYEGRISRNPLRQIGSFTPKFRDTILTDIGVREFNEFYSDIASFTEKQQNHARFFLCLLKTGQRPAMLRNLLKADDGVGNFVDFKRSEMVFRHHKTVKKTAEHAARIPFSLAVKRLMEDAMSVNSASDYVFCNLQRSHYRALPIAERWGQGFFSSNAAKFDTEGTGKFVLYSLRHTFGSQLVNASVPLIQVSNMMLHSSILMTQKYLKTTEKNRQSVVDRIDSLL